VIERKRGSKKKRDSKGGRKKKKKKEVVALELKTDHNAAEITGKKEKKTA